MWVVYLIVIGALVYDLSRFNTVPAVKDKVSDQVGWMTNLANALGQNVGPIAGIVFVLVLGATVVFGTFTQDSPLMSFVLAGALAVTLVFLAFKTALIYFVPTANFLYGLGSVIYNAISGSLAASDLVQWIVIDLVFGSASDLVALMLQFAFIALSAVQVVVLARLGD